MERAARAAPPVELGVNGLDAEVLGADEVPEDVVLLGNVGRDGACGLSDAEENACPTGGETVRSEAVLGDHVPLRASSHPGPAKVRIHVAEAGQREPVTAVAVERVLGDRGVLGAALQAIEDVVAEGVAADRPIPPCSSTQVRARAVVSDEIPGEHRDPRARRAAVDVADPVDEESRPGGPVDDAVVGEPEPVEVVCVQMEESAGADVIAPIDLVLIDGDVDPIVIEKHTVPGESSDAVVEELESVNGTSGRPDGTESSSTEEGEAVDDRAR